MMKLRYFVAIFAFSSFAFAQQSNAEKHDGIPGLCGHPWMSPGVVFESREVTMPNRIISECTVLTPDSLLWKPDTLNDPKFVNFLNKMRKDLWDSERLPVGILYRYNLKVINDRDKNIDFNLSDWDVIHSPYTWVPGSFVLKIPACSQAVIQFLSPWAPELRDSPINIGLPTDGSQGWSTRGIGSAGILTPVWSDYFSEGFRIEQLPVNEAKTRACSSPQ